ncbi:MAG TPA: hypothetical protein VFD71_10425 [Planctomycetota bacterium]|nr:hypothetical protein [Planctomycetota bacterium]
MAQFHALNPDDGVTLSNPLAQVYGDLCDPAAKVRGNLEQPVFVVAYGPGKDQQVFEIHRLDLPGLDARLGNGRAGESNALGNRRFGLGSLHQWLRFRSAFVRSALSRVLATGGLKCQKRPAERDFSGFQ